MLFEEAVDCGLEVDNGVEDAAPEATLRQLGEETLDYFGPRARGRREVESEALMAVEPSPHLGMLVSGVSSGGAAGRAPSRRGAPRWR